MNKLFYEVKSTMHELTLLNGAQGALVWDRETMMPEKGAGIRAEQLSELAGLVHSKFTSKKLGRQLKKLASGSNELSADQSVCVREWLKDYEKAVKLPEALVKEIVKTTSLANKAWVDARKKSSFKIFAPWLEKIVKLKKRQADCLNHKGCTRYDVLLDDYEANTLSSQIDPLFESLRDGLVPIIRAIRGANVKLDCAFLARRFPEAEQETLCKELMGAIGMDMKATRLDRVVHPFSLSTSPVDSRVTTRYDEKYLPMSIYGVIHESGHSMYEQGLPIKQFGTPLCEAASLGVHESQSRLWENYVGRSLPFIRYLHPMLKKRFPIQMKDVSHEKLYTALNRVRPSMIRVEADEVTYSLHIILRYEIEKALMSGDVRVKDLPGIWNDKMAAYLGVRPKNDAEGVLQDIHWSSGLIGYFPTYALGTLYAAQLWEKIRTEIRGVDSKIASGNFKPILDWLRRKIHTHGRRYAPAELISRATGKPPEAKYFIEYLKGKYGEIYKTKW